MHGGLNPGFCEHPQWSRALLQYSFPPDAPDAVSAQQPALTQERVLGPILGARPDLLLKAAHNFVVEHACSAAQIDQVNFGEAKDIVLDANTQTIRGARVLCRRLFAQ